MSAEKKKIASSYTQQFIKFGEQTNFELAFFSDTK